MSTESTTAFAIPPWAEAVAARHGALRLLVLHGSRAKGTAHAQSDWDFAFLAEPTLNVAQLHFELTSYLGTDSVDLADLDRASAVLRMQVAVHGVEWWGRPGEWLRFKLKAADFWCDAGPVIVASQKGYMARLVAKAAG